MRFCAKSDTGKQRYFPTFDAAERWARWYVGETKRESVVIYEDGDCFAARVSLDSTDRVWTDMLR